VHPLGWRPSKGNQISNLKHYTGAWDGKWECKVASIARIVTRIECSYAHYSNKDGENIKNTSIMKIGKNEKKYAQ
jgi:hypothetical protein